MGIPKGGFSQEKEVLEGGYSGEREIYTRCSSDGRVHVEVGQGIGFNGPAMRPLDSLGTRRAW